MIQVNHAGSGLQSGQAAWTLNSEFAGIQRIFCMLAVAIFVFGTANAQFNTGNSFIGANSGLSLDMGKDTYKSDLGDSDPYKTFAFSFNPKAGYFIKQRFAVGGMMEYSFSSSKLTADEKSSSSSFGIGPMVRYYRGYFEGISAFGEIAAGIGSTVDKQIFSESEIETKHKLSFATAGVGASYFLKENVAAEAMLQYYYSVRKPDGDNPNNNRHINSGLRFNVGVVIYILKI